MPVFVPWNAETGPALTVFACSCTVGCAGRCDVAVGAAVVVDTGLFDSRHAPFDLAAILLASRRANIELLVEACAPPSWHLSCSDKSVQHGSTVDR
jgi:hypothetical protein